MWVRFEHNLHSVPFMSVDEQMLGSRVIASRTLTDCCYRLQSSAAVNESLVDESKKIDESCLFFLYPFIHLTTDERVKLNCLICCCGSLVPLHLGMLPGALTHPPSLK